MHEKIRAIMEKARDVVGHSSAPKRSLPNNALMAYLFDKDNFSRAFEDAGLMPTRIVSMDFRSCPKHRDTFSGLEREIASVAGNISKDDREATEFADDWIRCDIIYKVKGGGYLVSEVDTIVDDNKPVLRAVEKRAVILDNIEFANFRRMKSLPGLTQNVRGAVIAYGIDATVRQYLDAHKHLVGVEINPTKVEKYAQEKYGLHVDLSAFQK